LPAAAECAALSLEPSAAVRAALETVRVPPLALLRVCVPPSEQLSIAVNTQPLRASRAIPSSFSGVNTKLLRERDGCEQRFRLLPPPLLSVDSS
jgi:hypothetical protein